MGNQIMEYGSTEYRYIQVTVKNDIQVPVNPTAATVDVAFIEHGAEPGVTTTWYPATWVTVGTNYFAKILVGPTGGVNLANTDWWVYVRVALGAELPVKLAGTLQFI